MTTNEIGKKYVALCREGKFSECLDALYAKDAVSVEATAMPGYPKTSVGLEALHAKGKRWASENDIHSMEISGPFPHDDRFAVRFVFDVTNKTINQRMKMEEVGIFTITGGKITKEEFFYTTG